MGAIAGIFHPNIPKPVDEARIRAMGEVMGHRGPDGEEVWTAPGIGMGQRRLGATEAVDAQARFHACLDGAIYNHEEIRRELSSLGYAFLTGSDKEILLAAWSRWGPNCLSRLNGDFALALWDAAARTLHLARDRLGAKPLHWTRLPDGALVWASELKGLLAHPQLRRAPDARAIEDYFALGYVPDDACMVAGVRKLPAGHRLELSSGKSISEPVRWWNVEWTGSDRRKPADLAAELRDLMDDAVRLRMAADAPTGAFLSGDAGDAAAVALMAGHSRRAVETRAVTLDPAHARSAEAAATIARRFGASHRNDATPAAKALPLAELVRAFDEPFASASAPLALEHAAFARASLAMALSGAALSQVFVAPPHSVVHDVVHHTVRQVRRVLEQHLSRWPRIACSPFFRMQGRTPAQSYAAAATSTNDARVRLYAGDLIRALEGHRAESRLARAFDEAPARDSRSRAQHADLTVRLPAGMLTEVDRAAMAVGLDVRLPWLDHRLVEFAAKLPPRLRARNGAGAALPLRAVERHLPRELLSRRSAPQAPLSLWLQGPLAAEIDGLAQGSRLAASGWFAPAELSRLIAEHRASRADHGLLLWRLLLLDRSLHALFG